MDPDKVAQNFNVSRSNVIKWVQQKEKLIDAAKSECENHFKIRRATKYVNLYKALKKKFKECTAKAYCISFAWLWFRARTICREQLGGNSAIAKHHHLIVNFIKRYNLQMRKKQRSKNVSKEDMQAKMLRWYSVLRERLTRTVKQDDNDEKWGRFRPECRLNVDRSPCPFVFDSNCTYHQFTEDQHNEKVWISQPGAGLDKRQCSLQICFSPEGKQSPLGIVFRGAGKRRSENERSSWHKDGHTFFEDNAWVDTKVTVDWVNKSLKPATEHLLQKRFVSFAKNLTDQVHYDFKENKTDALVMYGMVCQKQQIFGNQ